MLGGRMLYNDPGTITYVADSLYMKYINYKCIYIYIYIIHARIIMKASGRMVRPLLRGRGPVAEPRARSSVTRLVASCREQHAIAI